MFALSEGGVFKGNRVLADFLSFVARKRASALTPSLVRLAPLPKGGVAERSEVGGISSQIRSPLFAMNFLKSRRRSR